MNIAVIVPYFAASVTLYLLIYDFIFVPSYGKAYIVLIVGNAQCKSPLLLVVVVVFVLQGMCSSYL